MRVKTAQRFTLPLVAALLWVPTPVLADTRSEVFDPENDRAAWYWDKQAEAPAGGIGTILPDPQSPATLPVALQNGDREKISAVWIDLVDRGIPVGSTITAFDVTILEETAVGEAPGFAPTAVSIQACAIAGVWSPVRAGTWTQQPPHDETTCVEGSREEADGQATWTFELTALAVDWGEPILNRGFLLVGRAPEGTPVETWQVNLRRPVEDDPETEQNEHQQTKDSITFSVAYAAPTTTPSPTAGSNPASDPFGPVPSVFTAPPPAQGPSEQPAATALPPQQVPVATPVPLAVMPQIVWTLVPVGLLLTGLVSWIIMEPDPRGRPLWMRVMGFEPRGRTPPQ